ncbi:haloacid dehalogenase superfamily, subfamily IA, variant 3 with third motif having DD or ED [Tranquillimonas rosea]|uniref:Haloacid dehalogenase superfamily, subfamily IA, variant 3 with third motif having DD or ED n=1 Tax=Tranquillimonas rosea TaxID=641238 RepID=A0A1H9RSE7_9RHOB|nr:HAD-IA family hydrolase [Tranquillimonas rosea]SER75375.1 haloacid dehalogenase superfamily, subfamily IA, variant 3 with third motif having DD or ED [Tranquillimonas rosea]
MIIFDCDGVLVDSEILSCGIDAGLMREAGHPITTEELIAGYIGRPKREIWAAIAEERGVSWPDGLIERAEAMLSERIATDLAPVEGVHAALEALDVPRAVASSSRLDKLHQSLRQCGLLGHFSPHVYSAEQVARGKPAPDVFLFAATRAAADARSCLVIEDSVAGVTAARAAGMTAIGFTGGRHSFPGHAEGLRAAGAVAVVTSMRDLPATAERLHAGIARV